MHESEKLESVTRDGVRAGFTPEELQTTSRLNRSRVGKGRYSMSKETPKDDPHQQSDQGSLKQTDKPWKGNPEKEQRNDDTKIDLEKWHRTKTH